MKSRNIHVLPRKDGRWDVRREGSKRASFVTSTKQEAVSLGRTLSQNTNGEFHIHEKEGEIGAKGSHGHDPSYIHG